MRELNILASKHRKWCDLVRSLGCNDSYVEDIVQDAYIRIWEYLQKGVNINYGDDDVNEFYMYMTLRSIYFNSIKKKSIDLYEPINTEQLNTVLNRLKDDYSDIEMEDAYEVLIDKIFSEVNKWDFYSRNIFIAYFTSGLSLDKLSKDTGIGRSSLYNSIRKYREIIQDMFSEDAQNFYNKDYNKLK